MESSLHRQLKEMYGVTAEDREVQVEGFRIDAVAGGRLIEIQRASLSGIRSKLATLLESHHVTLVKPLAVRTRISRRSEAGGAIVSRRYSPVRRSVYHLFEELVHLGSVFPHPRLHLEVVLVEQEEVRIPRKKRRYHGADFQVEDRMLLNVVSRQTFRTARDLAGLLPPNLPAQFHTLDLAKESSIPRWLAQRMVYCMRQSGVLRSVGKVGNTILYAAVCQPKRTSKAA